MARKFIRPAAERTTERAIAEWFASRRAEWSRRAQSGRIGPRFKQEEIDALAAILFRRSLDVASRSLDETAKRAGVVVTPEVVAGLQEKIRRMTEAEAERLINKSAGEFRSRTARRDPELRELRLDQQFGRKRAEAESINVTTDSRSVGQLTVEELLPDDAEFDWLWITADDARVCPVCGPLHKKGRAVWSLKFPKGPKAHPRCRCDLQYQPKVSR